MKIPCLFGIPFFTMLYFLYFKILQGDIWAETMVMGFLWHYYACMEGAVYDITDWASCQTNNLRHLKPNSHTVQYRIVLGRQRQQNPRTPRYLK